MTTVTQTNASQPSVPSSPATAAIAASAASASPPPHRVPIELFVSAGKGGFAIPADEECETCDKQNAESGVSRQREKRRHRRRHRRCYPHFLRCLIDQLMSPQQKKEQWTHHRQQQQQHVGSTASTRTHTVVPRAIHDCLPVTLAIETGGGTAGDVNGNTDIHPIGVRQVTLMQPASVNAWLAHHHSAGQASSSSSSSTSVRIEQVRLAHANRCPCRAPMVEAPMSESESDDGDEHAATHAIERANVAASTAAAAGAPPPSPLPPLHHGSTAPHPHLRLAVVVVPTLLSVSHCTRCEPSAPSDTHPRVRALLTRRPALMRAFPCCWVFPGGGVEPGDRNLEETGRREMKEETGLDVAHWDEEEMNCAADDGQNRSSNERPAVRLVGLWEAVYPVIRPSHRPQGVTSTGTLAAAAAAAASTPAQTNPMPVPVPIPPIPLQPDSSIFIPKSRYLIAMYAAEAKSAADNTSTSSASSKCDRTHSSSSTPDPVCINCNVPLTLCRTEVDAAAWLSQDQLPNLLQHAYYFNAEEQSENDKQHGPQYQCPLSMGSTAASNEHAACQNECACEWLPAWVTKQYLEQNPSTTQLRDLPPHGATNATTDTHTTTTNSVSVAHCHGPTSVASVPSSTSDPSPPFLPARIRACTLYGLYPNREGSGVAEGHLFALEAMRELGLF